ncbi:hypothetical protein [Methanobrevibacter sp. DSM 116169]|uniref:hypothetical protein n=1 Tax=Methanobrevibacter sp. DSM 116169 TaxID=3242727 RepID=UPI0038FCFAE4
MDKKYIIIGVVVAIIAVVAVAAISISMMGEDTEEYYSNIKKAASHSESMTVLQNEAYASLDTAIDQSTLTKSEKLFKDMSNETLKEKEYLEAALESTDNETKKEYVESLLKINSLYKKIAEDDLKAAGIFKQYLDGSVGYSTLEKESSEIDASILKAETDITLEIDKINDILKKNPDLEKELGSLKNIDQYRGYYPEPLYY